MDVRWIVNVVVMFVLRQAARFGTQLDFAKIRADLAVRVRHLVPGQWFDDEAARVADSILVALERVFKDPRRFDVILDYATRGLWDAALIEVRAVLNQTWTPWPGTSVERRTVEDLNETKPQQPAWTKDIGKLAARAPEPAPEPISGPPPAAAATPEPIYGSDV